LISQYKEIYNKYFYDAKYSIVLLLLIIVISIVVGSMSPYIFGMVIDTIVDKNVNKITIILVLYISINALVSILAQIQGLIKTSLIMRLNNRIKNNLYLKAVTFTCAAKDKYLTGELVNRIESDSVGIISFYIELVSNALSIIANLSIALFFLMSIAPTNAGIVLLNIPVVLCINLLFRKKIEHIQKEQNQYNDSFQGFLHESLNNHVHIKAFLLEKKICLKFEEFMKFGYSLFKRGFYISMNMEILKSLLQGLINFFLMLVFALSIASGKMTIGNMVSFNSYSNKLLFAVSQIMTLHVTSIAVKLSLNRINQIEGEICEWILNDSFSNQEMLINNLRIDNIYFKYNEQENESIINGFSLLIDKPGFYCIVGKNGSGKSTVAKLIMKFYECADNKIFINEKDINKLSVHTVRRNVVYVSKDTYILNDTILNNLLIANPTCSFNDICNYSNIIGFHDDVMTFNNQYETLLGVNGITLSSGQQQKLNFVRALMKKGSVYLLDEITSDLDGYSEQEFINQFKSISKEFIVILITHKISSVIQSDKIFVVQNGKIQSEGRHEYLIHNCEEYSKLFDH